MEWKFNGGCGNPLLWNRGGAIGGNRGTFVRVHRRAPIALALSIIAYPALAADVGLPAYKAPPPLAFYDWTGCYLGAEGGGIWGTTRHDAANSGALTGQTITNDFAVSGSLIGGTVGCNIQRGNFVFGVENDLSWTNASGSAYDVPPFDPFTLSETKQNWLDTLRGRAGIGWDRWLGYITGGAAFTGTSASVCNSLGCVDDSQTRTGWTIGAGVEYSVLDNWTVKVEYLYANFGTARYVDPAVALPGGFTAVTRDVPLSESIARVGINYKFGIPALQTRN
jgi:outer membrane immunogenic protein